MVIGVFHERTTGFGGASAQRGRDRKDPDQSWADRPWANRSAGGRRLLFEPHRPDTHGNSQPASHSRAGRAGNRGAPGARSRPAAFFQGGPGSRTRGKRTARRTGAGFG